MQICNKQRNCLGVYKYVGVWPRDILTFSGHDGYGLCVTLRGCVNLRPVVRLQTCTCACSIRVLMNVDQVCGHSFIYKIAHVVSFKNKDNAEVTVCTLRLN